MQSPAYALIFASLALAGLFADFAQAEERNAADLSAVRAASEEYAAANRRGDLESVRKMWTQDGDYIDARGKRRSGRQLGQRAQDSSPESDDNDVASENTLRLITPDVAIEDGASGDVELPDGSVVSGRYTAVWVKRDGRWLLDSLRETAATVPPFNDELTQLEWLLGEWAAVTDDLAILVSSHWSDDGKYILREFLIRGDGRENISATQRIGWDESSKTIRCWTFDSLGSTSEGTWQRDGKRWLVKTTEALADGKKSKTSATYVPGDDGKFVLEVTSAWDGGDGEKAGPKLAPLRVEFRRANEEP